MANSNELSAEKLEKVSGGKQIYQAVCQKCGVTFDVPFPPREGHRILCPDCFEKEHKK
ncbi:MAG: hypothetical protein Q4F43_10420 [Eubacteriales bacterium]|nr:hypothetical protein [Eubacteriales bacterium]